VRSVKVLEVVDDGDVRVELVQEERRPEAGVRDDQVGTDVVAERTQRVVDAGGVPHGVLERA
jgi:hypothetical protein